MRPQLFLTLLLATCLSAPAQTAPVPVGIRLATQNAVFEELYQTDLKNAPERATAYGDYRYNDQLSDRSLAAIGRRHTADIAFLERLKAIPTTDFPEQDALSHDLLARVLQQRLDDYELKEYEMPVDQMNGVHCPRRPSPRHALRLCQALRGLHRTTPPDSPRPLTRRSKSFAQA